MNDLISRQAVLEICDRRTIRSAMQVWREVTKLPSAQPEQDREFIKLTVRNSNGKPYYSIIYLEVDNNGVGHDFEGYSSYSLDVISDYLKKYFMPSAQPELPKWAQKVERMYNNALTMPYIQKPLAWALYQVWKEYDNE